MAAASIPVRTHRVRGRATSNERGFTMLELMIAIGVLLVATLAAFGSQVTSFQLIDSSRDASTAMTDLELAMERVLALPAETIPAVGAFEEGVSISEFDDLHLRNQRITPAYPGMTGPDVPNPLDIVLTATWLDARGRPQRLTLATMKTW